MSHAPSGISVEDAFIEAIEYDVGATSVRIQLSRCFDESGRELALTLDFERVVHLASYCEPTFSAEQSLAIALLTVAIPPYLADMATEFGPWLELNPDFGSAGSRTLAIFDRTAGGELQCFLFEAMGLELLILCHEFSSSVE